MDDGARSRYRRGPLQRIEAFPRDTRPLASSTSPSPVLPNTDTGCGGAEQALASASDEPVFFLTAEPGAGKTSAVSWLTNRRVESPFAGRIGLRFFCFEPIRPEAPFIAPDASRVRPGELWVSLLTQLREGLLGRLKALRVPVRNDLLTWEEASAQYSAWPQRSAARRDRTSSSSSMASIMPLVQPSPCRSNQPTSSGLSRGLTNCGENLSGSCSRDSRQASTPHTTRRG